MFNHFNILQSLLCKIKVLFYFSCLFVRFVSPDNYARNTYLYNIGGLSPRPPP